MRVANGRSRFVVPRTVVALVLGCFACGYIAWISSLTSRSADGITRRASCLPEGLPTLCSHRIVGDEVERLSGQPLRAMAKLFSEGIYCFDADVVRLSDRSLYVGHPLMFKPVIEHKFQRPVLPEDGQTLTDAVLLQAQMLSHDDIVEAEPHLAHSDVRPVTLKSVLNTFSTSLAAYSDQIPVSQTGGKPQSAPRLFLEPKRNTYASDSLAQLWGLVEELELQEYVAVWAMDPAHYDILQNATEGKAVVIWGYMDQEFSDQVSTVPFPAPVPPQMVGPAIRSFGIAKHAPARHEIAKLGPASETLIALWVMDTVDEFTEACKEGADLVITNQPLQMKASVSANRRF
eukprot:jgi/Ulvmu1/7721/UM039_0027.1